MSSWAKLTLTGSRHEHYLAAKVGITENSTVLDVGCGIGGPAREICRFTDCNIVGLNNNDYQIERAMMHTETAGLTPKMKYVKGDFMVSLWYQLYSSARL